MKSPTIEVRLLSYTAVTDTIGVMTFAAQYLENFRVVKDAWLVRTVVVNDGVLESSVLVCPRVAAVPHPMISKTCVPYAWGAAERAALTLVLSMR